MRWRRPVVFVNGRIVTGQGEARSMRVRTRVLAFDEAPRTGDRVVDLEGAVVLPGLVNAHEHLELNHYGRLKFRDCYRNVSGWIDDMRPRLRQDPAIVAGRSYRLADRLFIGVLKNLLSGVTTVAHHNPFYRELWRGAPIRVLRRYGWAHSFALERQPSGARGEPGGDVAARFRATAGDKPFFVHLAEGIDESAREELTRLDRLGCLAPNSVLVHGVGIDAAGWARVQTRGAALVWCPASNVFLFNRTAPVRAWLDAGSRRIALGSDSRLSGERDLLDELRAAAAIGPASDNELLAMVTTRAGQVVRRPLAGCLAIGAPADLLVIPAIAPTPAASLLAATRSDIRLVMVGGRPLIADPGLDAVFTARGVSTRTVAIDTQTKSMDAAVARRIASCAIREPGVEAA